MITHFPILLHVFYFFCISLFLKVYFLDLLEAIYTMKLWHWKSHWKCLWHWKDTETTLKNIYKGNHSDNPGLSHWNIFLCCSRTLKSHWKVLNHTEKFSALLIPFVPRFFSVTVNFQCDFQCHNFIVIYPDHASWQWLVLIVFLVVRCVI